MQSIIVYRNPVEAAVWEGLLNTSFLGYLAPVLVGFLVGILVYAAVMIVGYRLAPQYQFRRRNAVNPIDRTATVLSWSAGLATFLNMLLHIV